MSSPATSFRLFYTDTNTLNSVSFFAPDGSALTPQTIADGSSDPAGFKSKVVTFAAASEPLLVTPTFAIPGSPVSLTVKSFRTGVIGFAFNLQCIPPFPLQHKVYAARSCKRHLRFQVAQPAQTTERDKNSLDKLPLRPVFNRFSNSSGSVRQ